jgi:hypothetical protein
MDIPESNHHVRFVPEAELIDAEQRDQNGLGD